MTVKKINVGGVEHDLYAAEAEHSLTSDNSNTSNYSDEAGKASEDSAGNIIDEFYMVKEQPIGIGDLTIDGIILGNAKLVYDLDEQALKVTFLVAETEEDSTTE